MILADEIGGTLIPSESFPTGASLFVTPALSLLLRCWWMSVYAV